MRRAFLIAALVVTGLASRGQGADEPLYGFSPATSKTEREWEKRFKAIPSPQIMRDNMRRLSAHPHHVGSPFDKENAEWILARFKSWGLDAHIEQYDVLFPTPKTRVVELVEPIRYVAKLQEPAVASDPTSSQQSEQLPSYNAYSVDGDVTASLVYVNFGTPKDYETLDRLGVSVKGAVVIARYGESWRGIKPKVAAEHGAVGCIIYSDPHEDGYVSGDVFPKGPMRNENGVQRGSVADMPLYPGDPLTPGVAARGNVKRLAIKDAPTITKIPVLPISYGDAKPLLAELKGPVAPKDFRGGLPITYHVGPGPAKVHLKVESNWDIKPIRNIIGKIRGAQAPDQWILRGNHHDAWVNGAEDPLSGQVALLEEARALSGLLKQGWKPKRTIIFCAWDGEEPGLLGSTEWCEDHADELAAHAALYLNSDGNGRGFLSAAGSHSLEKIVSGVARDIIDPEKNISVADRLKAQLLTSGNADVIKEVRTRADLRIGALGSGSDYTAFIDHLGIASLNIAFSGEDEGGIYHSVYDDFYWFSHFSDTDFVYGRALAQTAGTILMRFADADVLPYDFADFADTMHRYVTEVKKLLTDKQEEIRDRNEAIDQHLYDAASDPRHPLLPPPKQAVPPFLNFAPLDNALSRLDKGAQRYSKAIQAFARKRDGGDVERLAALNAGLIQIERCLSSPGGLPRRPWFKNLIYAPGFYTGYGVKTLPGIREGIEGKRYEEAEREISRVAQAISAFAASVDRVADEVEKNP
jgi:N-acetylated-alpha-linked acidic dipeptidase